MTSEKDIRYQLTTSKKIDKTLSKLHKKSPRQLKLLDKKILQIQKNPYHFKPLSGNMYGKYRVHIDASFVLVYEIHEREQVIVLLDYDHHDSIYLK